MLLQLKMDNAIYIRIIIIIFGSASVWGHCPPEKIQILGQCAFKIDCMHTIHFKLPSVCLFSSDYSTTVDLRVHDAHDDTEKDNDTSALETITILRTTGHLLKSNLTFLNFTPRLKHLFLIGNNITEIRPKPFYHLNRLETLDMSHNSLEHVRYLFKFADHDNMLKAIYLTKNNIQEIGDDDFEELHSLITLDLSHNEIKEISNGTFSKLNNLHELKINNNKIVSLNGALNDLKNLKKLFLKNNDLEKIDVDLELKNINHHLQTLDFSGNKVTELKPTVFWRHWLHFDGNSVCKINLSKNNINIIPNATSPRLTERFTRHSEMKYIVDVVTEVDLSKNNIKDIEYNAFQDVEKLQSLDVSANNIVRFRVNPDHLNDVKRLNLSTNNMVTLLFETFSKMTQLENLDVSCNMISFISESTFKNNINLRHVNFTFNKIKEVKYLQIFFNSGDGSINFSNNEIQVLTFGSELKLARLFLDYNYITDMSYIDLRQQHDLKYLQISNNYITSLNESSIRLPQNLEYLDLSQNAITYISPSVFANLGRLVTLRLSQNKVSTLEFGTFRGLRSLKSLDLSFNNIKKISSKMFMELKMLMYLSLKYNELSGFDDTIWISHEHVLTVFIDGNNLSCEWLSMALKNFNRGYSKMKPVSQIKKVVGNSVNGIPCKPVESAKLAKYTKECDGPCSVLADERLLMINKQILEEVKNQTNYLKTFFSQIQAKIIKN